MPATHSYHLLQGPTLVPTTNPQILANSGPYYRLNSPSPCSRVCGVASISSVCHKVPPHLLFVRQVLKSEAIATKRRRIAATRPGAAGGLGEGKGQHKGVQRGAV